MERNTGGGVDSTGEGSVARPGFRADIDGLRAVAILAVVLYHARVPGFEGGFVGVDVFFVISGYLITRNLLTEREETGRIALWAFWGRRVRRLAPALALVTVVTLAASLLVLSPLEWRETAGDAIASTLYVSNLTFARRATDYFADGSSSLFLHTWSLSVEEQFYVVWPILAAVTMKVAVSVRRSGRGLLAAGFLAVTVASFSLSVLLTGRGTPWAFFSLPTRAWQFAAAGALAAAASEASAPRWLRTPLGWGGLAMIGWSIVAFDGLTAYPGRAAAVPTIGALLVIASGGITVRAGLDQLLASRPAQLIGRVSYSWYLWHWPVMLLAVAALDRDELGVRVAAMIASLGMGAVSYRYVEQPVRSHPRLRRSARTSVIVGLAFAAVALAAAGGLRLAARHELAKPFYADLQAAAADGNYRLACRAEADLPETCVLGPATATTTVMLIGDSHAQAWIPAFAVAADDLGIRVLVRARGGCPGSDVAIAKQGTRDASSACSDFRAQTATIVSEAAPDLAVLSNASFLGRVLTSSGHVGTDAAQVAAWRAAFADQVRTLSAGGAAVGVILGGPQLPFDPISCVGRTASVEPCAPTRAEAMAVVDPIRSAEAAVAERGHLPTFDAANVVCSAAACRLRIGSTYTLLDPDHMTASFSRSRGSAIAAYIRKATAGP
ncbi:acyltransferase family protein [soil metagenome]